MTALTSTSTNYKRDLIPVGDKKKWVKDLALVGGLSSFVAPLGLSPALLGGPYPYVAGAVGAVTGMVLGVVLPRVLSGPLKKTPIPLLLAGGLGIGALWGATVGAVAGLTLSDWAFQFSIWYAGAAGAIQLGWFWLPYTRRMILKKRTWPILAAAAIAAPFLAHAGGVLLNILFKIF